MAAPYAGDGLEVTAAGATGPVPTQVSRQNTFRLKHDGSLCLQKRSCDRQSPGELSPGGRGLSRPAEGPRSRVLRRWLTGHSDEPMTGLSAGTTLHAHAQAPSFTVNARDESHHTILWTRETEAQGNWAMPPTPMQQSWDSDLRVPTPKSRPSLSRQKPRPRYEISAQALRPEGGVAEPQEGASLKENEQ